ncbi:HSP20-like chaperone [Limtongia smithiae]|uniref:HSP20-like chaperone n=1 Tax=Limtongia smithiae TaxID=1125753 RepID=UPI0034CF5F47
MSLSRFFAPPATTRDMVYPSRLFRLLDDPGFFSALDLPTPLASSLDNTAFTRTPTFDVKETDNEFVLQGELPGVEKDNLSLEFVDPHTLSVRGVIEKTKDYEQPPTAASTKASADADTAAVATAAVATATTTPPKYWASERVHGEFSRAFRFPSPVDADNVSASLKNGVLSVTVPKAAAAPEKKKIEVATE